MADVWRHTSVIGLLYNVYYDLAAAGPMITAEGRACARKMFAQLRPHWTTRYESTLAEPIEICFRRHCFMAIDLRFFQKKKKKKNMLKTIFTHVLHNWSTNFCRMVIFHTFFKLISLKWKLQIESENEQNLYGFQWG